MKNKKSPPKIVILFFLFIAFLTFYASNNDNEFNNNFININNNTRDKNKFLDINKSNKIGLEMSNSLKKIENILKNINNTTTVQQINDDINIIQNLNLSSDYTSYQEMVIQKLLYYKKYIETNDNSYIDQYNQINVLEELTKVFDKIGIKYYWTDDNNLIYDVKIE